MRRIIALISNLVLPGAGLILLRREWLGLAHACLFCLAAHFAIWGYWIVPAALPPWLPPSAVALAGIVWVTSQLLNLRLSKLEKDPESKAEIQQLKQMASELVAEGQSLEAVRLIDVALRLDDEDRELRHKRAELARKSAEVVKETSPPRGNVLGDERRR